MSASITTRNELKGTRLVRNRFDRMKDRGFSLYEVDLSSPDVPNLNSAVNAIISDQPRFPGTLIPLEQIETRYWSGSTAIAKLTYRRPSFAWSDDDVDPFKLASVKSGVISRKWYELSVDSGGNDAFDSLGRPNGVLNMQDGDTEERTPPPVAWTRTIPVRTYTIFATLSKDPTDDVAGLVKTVNSDKLTWGDKTIDALTLRFDGHETSVVNANGAFRYPTTYQFTERQEEWVKEFVNFDESLSPSKWVVTLYNEYPKATFGGKFPVK